MRKFILLSIALIASVSVFSQDFSNKGKDFYLCFPQHVPSGTNLAQLSIFITSDKASSGTITMPNSAFTGTFNIAANGLQEIIIPWSASIHISNGESTNGTTTQILKKSIHIKTDPGKPAVVAYAQQWAGARSCATLLLPTNVVGKKYFVSSFIPGGSNTTARSQFQVIATKDNTNVEITPMKSGIVGTTFTVTLPLAGDMIQYQSNDGAASSQDLTGTYIEAVSVGVGVCSPITVFSGSSNSTLGHPSCSGSSYDPFWQQLYPISTWGKNFGFVPFQDYPNGSAYRVMASEDNTNVYFNGALVANLNKGKIYPAAFTVNPQVLTSPTSITADKPICVTQFALADACSGQPSNPPNPQPPTRVGDPDMVILNPIEQNISDITIFESNRQAITRYYVNVLMKTIATPSFTINAGAVTVGTWQPFASLPGYSYLKQTLSTGSFRLKADSGFNAIAYGWGNVESYAYSAGTNVKDLYQQIGVHTQYGIEITPSVCTGTPFQFKVSLPYCADSISWDLSNLPGPPVAPPTQIYTTCLPGPGGPDSTTFVNGVPIHWYSLPALYNINTVGTYPVTITTYAPNIDGCGNVQDIDFDLQVSDPPVAAFTYTSPGCYADTVRFTETTPQIPKTTFSFWWDFGDPASGAINNTSSVRNPSHAFSGPGTYNVRFSDITTPGCLSDTVTHQVTVNPLPDATISGTTTVCINAASPNITFTGTGGTAEYVFSYTIDNGGGPGPTQFATSAGGVAQIAVLTNVAGTFTYTLTGIRNAVPVGTFCTLNIAGQQATVTVTPGATITLTSAPGTTSQTVCINNPITNINYGIGASGTGASIIAGALPAGVTGTFAGGVFTIAGTPTVSGVFNYTVGTTGPCINTSLGGTITVNADASIALSSGPGTDAQTVCINNPIVTISYLVAGSGTGASITAGVLPAGVTGSFVGGTFSITGTPTVAGVFNYTVTTTGPCVNNAVSGTITVNDNSTITLSSAAGTNAQVLCVNTAIANITYALGGGATSAAVTAGALPTGVTGTFAAGVFTISGTPTVSGVFNYTISAVGPCTNPSLSGTITVYANASINLTSGPGTDAQTICINNPIITISYTIAGGGTGASITAGALPAGVTGSFAGGVFSISGTPTVAGVFNYTVTTTSTCINNSLSGSITVNDNSTLTLSSAAGTNIQSLCINTPITTISYAVGLGGTGATITIGALPAGVTGTFAGGVFTISGTPTVPGVFNYTVTTTGPCTNPSLSGTITVADNSLLNLTSGPGTDVQTACINNPIINITYAVTGGGTGASITAGALPAGVTGTYAGGVFNITGTPTVAGVFNYTVTTTGPCINNALSGTLTVNDNSTLTLSSAPGSNIQTLCINNVITTISYAVGFGGTGASITAGALPTGVTGTFAAGVFTISGTPTVAGVFNYTVTTTGPCNNPSLSGTLTVNDNSLISLTSAPGSDGQVVCINTPIADITYNITGGGTGASITAGALPAGVTGTYAGGIFTISGTPTVNGVFNYTVTTTGPCINNARSGTITVNTNATLTISSAPGTDNQTVCINTAITNITYAISGTGTGASITAGALPTGVTGTFAAGVFTISGTPTVPGLYSYTISSTGPCGNGTASGTITVDDNSSISLSSAAGSNIQTVCNNTAVIDITYAIAGGGTGASITAGSLPAGVTGTYAAGVFTITGTPTANGVFNYTVTTTGPCINNALSGSITINPIPTASIAGNIEACEGSAPDPDITFTGAGGTRPYTFTYTINGGLPLTVSTTAASNSVTVQQTTAAPGTFVYDLQRVADGTITACNQAQSGTVTVKVNPLPTATISGNKLICINSIPPDITFTGAGGTLPYTFTYTINAGPPQSIITTGGNSSVTVPVSTSVAGLFLYHLVSVKDGSVTGCTQAQPADAVVAISNIFPNPDFWFNDPVCLPNAMVNFQNRSTILTGTPMTYLWSFGDGFTSTAFQPSHQYTSQGPFNVILQATSIAGCVAQKVIPMNNIHPKPKADFITDVPSVCAAGEVTFTDQSDPKDGVTQQWFWNMGDGNNMRTRQVTYRYADTITYNVSLYTVNTFGCNSDTITRPFTVYPYPKVNAGPDRYILEGGTITLEPIVYGNNLQYLWTPNLYMLDNTKERPIVNDPKDDITYTLTVTGRGGCPKSDAVFVKLLKFPRIPNTFTPNNDGINDTWRIDYLDTYPSNWVQVFTRNGQLVFESHGYTKPWDGTIKGKPLPFDTYYYIIEPGNGREPMTGYVTIVK